MHHTLNRATNRLKAMNDLFIDPESVSSPALVNNIAHALSSQDKDHVIELSVGPSKFFTVNNITAAGCKSLLEYLAGEAVLLNPEILCKNHKNLASMIMKECPNCAPLNTSMEEMEESTPAIVVSNLNFGYDKERNVLEQVRTTPPHSPPLLPRPSLLTALGLTPSPSNERFNRSSFRLVAPPHC